MKRLFQQFLRKLSHLIPDVRYIRAIPNLIIKPIHDKFITEDQKEVIYKVFDFQMILNLHECVDSAIYFTPHLYDNKEIQYILANIKYEKEPIILDVGANIGFWSLYLAKKLNNPKIISIEANPNTFSILSKNIEINGIKSIQAVNIGVSDKTEKIPFYCNTTGNRGGDSFQEENKKPSMHLKCKPLLNICREYSLTRINAIKFDIEGFEFKVLSKFFADAPNCFFPKIIVLETCHCNFDEINAMMLRHHYKFVKQTKYNSVYAR